MKEIIDYIHVKGVRVLRIYVVQKGDSLYKIAKEHHVALEDLIKLNPHIANPDAILPGMKIKIPSGVKPLRDEKKEMNRQTKELRSAKVNERPMGKASENLYDIREKSADKQHVRNQEQLSQATSDKRERLQQRDRQERRADQDRAMMQETQRATSPEELYRKRKVRYPAASRYELFAQRNRYVQNEMYRPQYVCPCCMRPFMADHQLYPPYHQGRPRRR